jgi:hypothetical protein
LHGGRPRHEKSHLAHARALLHLIQRIDVVRIGGDHRQSVRLGVVDHGHHAEPFREPPRNAIERGSIEIGLHEALGGDEARTMQRGQVLQELLLGQRLDVDERILDAARVALLVAERFLVLFTRDAAFREKPFAERAALRQRGSRQDSLRSPPLVTHRFLNIAGLTRKENFAHDGTPPARWRLSVAGDDVVFVAPTSVSDMRQLAALSQRRGLR